MGHCDSHAFHLLVATVIAETATTFEGRKVGFIHQKDIALPIYRHGDGVATAQVQRPMLEIHISLPDGSKPLHRLTASEVRSYKVMTEECQNGSHPFDIFFQIEC